MAKPLKKLKDSELKNLLGFLDILIQIDLDNRDKN